MQAEILEKKEQIYWYVFTEELMVYFEMKLLIITISHFKIIYLKNYGHFLPVCIARHFNPKQLALA